MSQLSNVGFAYPKAVQDASERIKTSYVQAQNITVEFHPEKGVMAKFVHVEFQAIAIEAQKENVPLNFDEEKFAKYCNTFLKSRVAWVTGDMSQVVVRPTDRVACPALLDAILKNIGVVIETKQGLTLAPSIGKCDTLTIEEMNEISFTLNAIKNYVGGSGFIADKSGSWEFMSMQLVESVILSEVDVHPAYSTLAAVVGPQWLGAVTAPRIKYGDLNLYEALLWQMTSVQLG